MQRVRTKNDDIPMPLALALLAVVLLLLISGSRLERLADLGSSIESLADKNGALLGISVFLAFTNFLVIHSVVGKTLSFRRQGSRLRTLTGQSDKSTKKMLQQLIGITVASILAFGVFWFLDSRMIVGVGVNGLPVVLSSVLRINAAISCGIISHYLRLWIKNIRQWRALSSALGPRPFRSDGITLGTKVDKPDSPAEKWVEITKKGLCGNILITGSIGSGKTQGTILPYLDQVLGNLKPSPSVLAIDPKGTFIREAVRIVESRGVQDRVLHLKLDGSIRFNPIYVDDVLKMGRFLDVAQMIRAAAVNFAGRGSSDSPFWELSAFNLTKNALIYCAAVYGYYTLNDLYKVMVDAVDSNVAGKLDEILGNGDLGEEEAHNVREALVYFNQEFQSFDPKLKTGILATATSFLNQFQEYQASRIFCPPEHERTVKSMDEVVDGGKILLFDINTPGLARAMGTFIKLHFQRSVLNRLIDEDRTTDRPALLIVDEYQDVVSSGYGSMAGDDRFLAKGREANAITIAATQSLSSIENSLGRSHAAKELCQNFRTRIACHSTDLSTIRTFQDLIGEEEREKTSHSYSELSQDTRRNYMLGGFDADNANISESVSKSMQREWLVTGKDFSRLKSFESLALIFDGIKTEFVRLNLKPYFLRHKIVEHRQLHKMITATAACTLAVGVTAGSSARAFPNLCDVVKQPEFSSCLDYQVGACTCGYPPHPCASFSYYVPDTFVEVTDEPGSTKFTGLPGVETQLASGGMTKLPFGTEGGDFNAFHAHTLPVPFSSIALSAMPCGGGSPDTTCFGGMSEHLGANWTTGAADIMQPNFLAWSASPKGCLMYGAARSVAGGGEGSSGSVGASCSVPIGWLTQYPPSTHSACNGWGSFYPRIGIYEGPSQTIAALMVGARLKSIAGDVFRSNSTSPMEKWQMIYPSASSCFREGQNVGLLEVPLMANDRGRMAGRLKDYLFVTWKRVSCCKEVHEVPIGSALLASLRAACQGLGGLP